MFKILIHIHGKCQSDLLGTARVTVVIGSLFKCFMVYRSAWGVKDEWNERESEPLCLRKGVHVRMNKVSECMEKH